MKSLVVMVAALMLQVDTAFPQCACMGGAAVGGLTPLGGTANIGVLREGFGRISVMYRYSGGNTTMNRDARATTGPVVGYQTQYASLLLGYGITERFTLESEIGFYPRKMQDFTVYTIDGSGLSHAALIGKVNLYHSLVDELEISAGAGARVPFVTERGDALPQHIQASTGAYGVLVQGVVHKGWYSQGFHLALLHQSQLNSVNTRGYQYGTNVSTSIIAGQTLAAALMGFLEVRHDYRDNDRFQEGVLHDTGGSVVNVSPQLNVVLGEVNVSGLVDIPVYRFYNGHQLATDYSFALNLSWQPHLFGE